MLRGASVYKLKAVAAREIVINIMEVLVREPTDLKSKEMDHQTEVCCSDRASNHDDHTYNHYKPAKDELHKQAQETERLCKKVQQHRTHIQSILQCLEMQEKEITRQKEAVSKKIEAFVKQIISTAQESGRLLQENVHTMAEQMLDSIAIQKEKGEKLLCELKVCQKSITTENSDTNDEIFKKTKLLKEQMENALQLSEQNCIEKPENVGLCLIPNEEVLLQCKCIGEITALSFPKRRVSFKSGGIARCTGKGSVAAIAGKERNFTLQLPSQLGGFLSCYLYNEKNGRLIQSRVEEASPRKHLEGNRQVEHRIHNVSYTPTHHGFHLLKVLVGGIDVPCEPPIIQVLPTPRTREQHVKIYDDLISPLGIALNDEVVVVSEFSNNSICVYNNYGQIYQRFGNEGSGKGELLRPSGIALTPDHHIVVVDNGNHRIQKFKFYGTCEGSVGLQGNGPLEFNSPCDVAVDRRGKIYVSDTGNHCIQVLHSDLTYSHRIGKYGKKLGQLSYPKGITVDSKGNIYVCDGQNSRVQKFSSSGTFLHEFGKEVLHHPRFIGVDSYNILYVTDKELGEVLMFDNDGEYLGSFGAIETARGVTVDSENNVYVCNIKKNNVCVYQYL